MTVEYRNLGNSGLKVSTLCLGTMTFGEADDQSFMHKVGCNEEMSHDLLNKSLDAGINFIDTAAPNPGVEPDYDAVKAAVSELS